MDHYFLPSELISTILGFLTFTEQRRLNGVSSRLQPLVLYWVKIKRDTEITALRCSCDAKDWQYNQLQRDYNQLKRDYNQLQRDYNQLKSDFNHLLEDNRRKDIRITQLEEENREKGSQFNQLLREFAQVRQELHELKQQFRAQAQSNANLVFTTPHCSKASRTQEISGPGILRKRNGQEVDIVRKRSREEDISLGAYELTRLLPFYSGLDPQVASVTVWTAQKAFEMVRRKISYLNLPPPKEGFKRLKIVTSNTQLDPYELNSSLCTSFHLILDVYASITLQELATLFDRLGIIYGASKYHVTKVSGKFCFLSDHVETMEIGVIGQFIEGAANGMTVEECGMRESDYLHIYPYLLD